MAASPAPRRLEQLSWPQLQAAAQRPGSTVVWPLGAFDQLEREGAVLPDAEGLQTHVRLDIRVAQRLQLLRAGLDAEQISSCPLCTVAEPLLFHSWRRDQRKAVQWSGIVSQQLDAACLAVGGLRCNDADVA